MRDLTGNKYGKLLVISLTEVKKYPKQTKSYWRCGCECGNTKIVRGEHLSAGTTVSCGCAAKNNATRHGYARRMNNSPEYRAWLFMRNRLRSKEPHKVRSYKGISYDSRWDDFANFLADMGKKPTPKHELDRINPFSHYCKDNCRWATRSEQMLNTRRHYMVK